MVAADRAARRTRIRNHIQLEEVDTVDIHKLAPDRCEFARKVPEPD